MRHVVIRSIMSLIWVVVAIAGLVNGTGMISLVYAVVGVAFGLNAWKQYKKLKADGEK